MLNPIPLSSSNTPVTMPAPLMSGFSMNFYASQATTPAPTLTNTPSAQNLVFTNTPVQMNNNQNYNSTMSMNNYSLSKLSSNNNMNNVNVRSGSAPDPHSFANFNINPSGLPSNGSMNIMNNNMSQTVQHMNHHQNQNHSISQISQNHNGHNSNLNNLNLSLSQQLNQQTVGLGGVGGNSNVHQQQNQGQQHQQQFSYLSGARTPGPPGSGNMATFQASAGDVTTKSVDSAYRTFQELLNEAQPNLRLLKTNKKIMNLNATSTALPSRIPGPGNSNGGGQSLNQSINSTSIGHLTTATVSTAAGTTVMSNHSDSGTWVQDNQNLTSSLSLNQKQSQSQQQAHSQPPGARRTMPSHRRNPSLGSNHSHNFLSNIGENLLGNNNQTNSTTNNHNTGNSASTTSFVNSNHHSTRHSRHQNQNHHGNNNFNHHQSNQSNLSQMSNHGTNGSNSTNSHHTNHGPYHPQTLAQQNNNSNNKNNSSNPNSAGRQRNSVEKIYNPRSLPMSNHSNGSAGFNNHLTNHGHSSNQYNNQNQQFGNHGNHNGSNFNNGQYNMSNASHNLSNMSNHNNQHLGPNLSTHGNHHHHHSLSNSMSNSNVHHHGHNNHHMNMNSMNMNNMSNLNNKSQSNTSLSNHGQQSNNLLGPSDPSLTTPIRDRSDRNNYTTKSSNQSSNNNGPSGPGPIQSNTKSKKGNNLRPRGVNLQPVTKSSGSKTEGNHFPDPQNIDSLELYQSDLINEFDSNFNDLNEQYKEIHGFAPAPKIANSPPPPGASPPVQPPLVETKKKTSSSKPQQNFDFNNDNVNMTVTESQSTSLNSNSSLNDMNMVNQNRNQKNQTNGNSMQKERLLHDSQTDQPQQQQYQAKAQEQSQTDLLQCKPVTDNNSNLDNSYNTNEYDLEQLDNDDNSAIDANAPDRVPCPYCDRLFAKDRLEKHAKICQKAGKRKRKQFDVQKQRVEGEAKEAMRKETMELKSTQLVKRSKWKSKSEDFREAIKNAREISIAEKKFNNGNPLSSQQITALLNKNCTDEEIQSKQLKKQKNDDRIPCPHCHRRFDSEVAKRHIPKCKETKAKPNKLMKGGGTLIATVNIGNSSNSNSSNSNSLNSLNSISNYTGNSLNFNNTTNLNHLNSGGSGYGGGGPGGGVGNLHKQSSSRVNLNSTSGVHGTRAGLGRF